MMLAICCTHAMEKENETSRTLYYCNKKSFDRTKRVMLAYQNEDKVWPLSLTVLDIQNKEKPKIIFNILFPKSYRFTAINFNQQGTHLLVRFFKPDHGGKEHKKRMLFALNYADLYWNK